MVLLYIDPGSGSFLIQFLIAGALGVAFFFKTIWYRISSVFGAKRPMDSDTAADPLYTTESSASANTEQQVHQSAHFDSASSSDTVSASSEH